MASKHSRERHELVAARKLLKLEVGRIRKRLVRGSATARDEWWFNFITGRDASTVSRENQFQRRYRLAKESLRRLITKEEASTVERHWYHKLLCGEDVESVMSEMAKARFCKTKPANLDLEASAMHLHEARNEILEENYEPLNILIELVDTLPADEVAATQPDLQFAAPDSTIPTTQSTIDQVIDESNLEILP